MSAPAILVGTLVRVARPVGGGPVNREGHTGRVIDIAGDRHGREALVQYSGEPGPSQERWVPLRYLVPAATPLPPGAILADEVELLPPGGREPASIPLDGKPSDYYRANRAIVAEPEGHDEHLDAIEDAIAKARRTPTYDVALSMRHLGSLGVAVIGDIRANLGHRAELVEKGLDA